MNHCLKITAFALLLFVLSSCGRDKRDTGVEYAAQMYTSIPVEPYMQTEYFSPTNNWTSQKKTMREPVKGTIAFGKVAYYYPYANNNEGYEQAGKELKNPLPYTTENFEEGKRLFVVNCAHCHGETGDGEGAVIATGKFPSPGAYSSKKQLTEGHMFHSITWGKNMMGPHHSQLSPEERWKVVHYIRNLQGAVPEPGASSTAQADTTGN